MRRTKLVVGRIGLVGGLVTLVTIASALASSNTIIRSVNTTKYGRILEGPAGYTLYVFCVGTSTHCTGAKSSMRPPLIARGRAVPAAHSNINVRKLSTRRLPNGQHQVTYYGQPLYLYRGDRKPGQRNGEQMGNSRGTWFVIDTSGRPKQNGGY